MKSYVVYSNYDQQRPVGRVELNDEVSDEAISDCVLGPMILLGADGSVAKISSFGMFPRVNTDIRDRS